MLSRPVLCIVRSTERESDVSTASRDPSIESHFNHIVTLMRNPLIRTFEFNFETGVKRAQFSTLTTMPYLSRALVPWRGNTTVSWPQDL